MDQDESLIDFVREPLDRKKITVNVIEDIITIMSTLMLGPVNESAKKNVLETNNIQKLSHDVILSVLANFLPQINNLYPSLTFE
jgi:hypothetical protein